MPLWLRFLMEGKTFKLFDTEDPGDIENRSEEDKTDEDNQDEKDVDKQLREAEGLLEDEDTDIDAYLDQISKGKVPTKETTRKKVEKTEDKTSEEKEDLPEDEKDEGQPKAEDIEGSKTPEKKEDKTSEKPDKTETLISDEYIESRPEEEKEALKSIRGKRVDNQILKNYVNAQLYIQKSKQERFKKTPDEQRDLRVEKPSVQQQPEDINKIKHRMLVRSLQQKFPDVEFPSEAMQDEKELREFINDTAVGDFVLGNDLIDAYRQSKKESEQTYTKLVDLQQNWEAYAEDQINKDIGKFKEYVKNTFSVDLNDEKVKKDLDLDLDLREENGDKTNPYIFGKLLFNDNGEVNPKIVRFYNNSIPVVVPDQLYYSLIEETLPKIKNLLEIKSREEGFQRREEVEQPPSQSAAKIPGERKKPAKKRKPEDIIEDPNSTPEEYEEALAIIQANANA